MSVRQWLFGGLILKFTYVREQSIFGSISMEGLWIDVTFISKDSSQPGTSNTWLPSEKYVTKQITFEIIWFQNWQESN